MTAGPDHIKWGKGEEISPAGKPSAFWGSGKNMDNIEESAFAKPLEPGAWRQLYRVGAVSAFVYVFMILVPLVLLVAAPQPPLRDGAAILQYIAAHRAIYLVELVCFVGLSVPAVIVFFALGVALFRRSPSLVSLGALIGVVSEVVALALGSSPPSLNGGLIVLSGQYSAAGETLRPTLASAADALAAGANAVSSAGILTALGILILSLAMGESVFRKVTAILGIATGALGIVSEALRDYIGPAYGLYGILLPLWFVLAGLGLGRLDSLGKSAEKKPRRSG